MKQLRCKCSRDKFEFVNACHRLFKCIQRYIFKSSIYVGINVLVVSLQSVQYCLLTPPFVPLDCWIRNSIASVHMIQLALSLTSSPRIASNLEPLLMVILTLLLSGGPLCLALETVDIHNSDRSRGIPGCHGTPLWHQVINLSIVCTE